MRRREIQLNQEGREKIGKKSISDMFLLAKAGPSEFIFRWWADGNQIKVCFKCEKVNMKWI